MHLLVEERRRRTAVRRLRRRTGRLVRSEQGRGRHIAERVVRMSRAVACGHTGRRRGARCRRDDRVRPDLHHPALVIVGANAVERGIIELSETVDLTAKAVHAPKARAR